MEKIFLDNLVRIGEWNVPAIFIYLFMYVYWRDYKKQKYLKQERNKKQKYLFMYVYWRAYKKQKY
jgi:hypothetical protein